MTALATTAQHAIERGSTLTRDQLDLLKRTIAKGTTDDEFALFVSTSNRLGLDPFARQIFAVKRWDSRENREVMSIQVSIDGFRVAAARTNELDGQDGPYWCGEDGVWRDVWLGKTAPAASKVLVYRRGCAHPFVGVATYASYAQKNRDGNPNAMWARGADFMLAKCAEAVALRKAFPNELSGAYTTDEIGADDAPATPAVGPMPANDAPASSHSKAADTAKSKPPIDVVSGIPESEVQAFTEMIAKAKNHANLKQVGQLIAKLKLAPDQATLLRTKYEEQQDLIDDAAQAEMQAGGR